MGVVRNIRKRLIRLRRGFARVSRKAWKVCIDDTTTELRGYRNRILNYWRERRRQRKRSRRSFWSELPANLVQGPIFAVQMLFIGIAMMPLLAIQSLRYCAVGLWRLATWAPGKTWKFVKARNRWELAAGGLVLAIAAGAGGYLLLRTRAARDPWQEYREFVRKGDIKAVKAELAALKERMPDDVRIDQRIAAWESGAGPEDDPEVVQQLMLDHVRNGRLEAAAREAAKYITRHPTNWYARCLLAQEALKRKEITETRLHLAKMDKIREAAGPKAQGLNAFWARLAMDIAAKVGDRERVDECLDYIAGPRLRLLGAAQPDQIHPLEAVPTLQAWQTALVRFKLREDLIGNWMAAQKIAAAAAASPDVTAQQLLDLGRLQERNLAGVAELRRNGVKGFATDEEARAASEPIEANLERIWVALAAKDPRNVMAYLGRATREYRAGRTNAAVAAIDEGLKVCSQTDAAALNRAKSRLLRLAGKTAEERTFLDESLASSPGDLQLLHLAVESTLERGDTAKALEACRQAAEHKPTPYWFRRTEARLCLDSGRPQEAVAALETVPDEVRKDPAGLRMYVRSLAATGRMAEAEAYLAKVVATEEQRKLPSNWAVVLVGAAGLGDAGKSAEAGRWAERAVAADPESVPARLLLADSLRAQLDRSKSWDPVLLRKCIEQYDLILRKSPENIVAANNLVWLEMKSGARGDAVRHSTVLRKAADSPKALPEILDTMGALCNATGDYAEARRLMERALNGPVPRASYYCNLAEALLGLKKPREAEAELRKIEILKLRMNDRESSERDALLEKIKAQS